MTEIQTTNDAQISQWLLQSYKGDADFVFGTQNLHQGLAGVFMTHLKSLFLRDFLVKQICGAVGNGFISLELRDSVESMLDEELVRALYETCGHAPLGEDMEAICQVMQAYPVAI